MAEREVFGWPAAEMAERDKDKTKATLDKGVLRITAAKAAVPKEKPSAAAA